MSNSEEIYRSNESLAVLKIERANTTGIIGWITNKSDSHLDIDLALASHVVRWNEKPDPIESTWYEGCERTPKQQCQNTVFKLLPKESRKVSWNFKLQDQGKFSFPLLNDGKVIDSFSIQFVD